MEKQFSKHNIHNIQKKFLEKIESTTVLEDGTVKKVKWAPAMAALLCFCLTTTIVFAAMDIWDLKEIYNSFYDSLNKADGPLYEPVEIDGIQVQIAGAVADEGRGYVFFTVTDVTEDRLSPQDKLYDVNISVEDAGISYPLTELAIIDYDETENQLTMVAGGHLGNNQPERFLLQIGGIAMDVLWNEKQLLPSLYEAAATTEPETITMKEIRDTGQTVSHMYGADSIYENYTRQQWDGMLFLKPGAQPVVLDDISWLAIGNIGFVEGNLQIQYHYPKTYREFYAEYISLQDEAGNMLDVICSVEMDNQNRIDVYDVHSLADLASLKLVVSYRDAVFKDGPWKMAFTFDQAFSTVQSSGVVKNHPFIEEIDMAISPMGVQLYLQCTKGDVEEIWASVQDYLKQSVYLALDTGQKIPLVQQVSGFDHQRFVADADYIGGYFDMEQLKALVIGEEVFILK